MWTCPSTHDGSQSLTDAVPTARAPRRFQRVQRATSNDCVPSPHASRTMSRLDLGEPAVLDGDGRRLPGRLGVRRAGRDQQRAERDRDRPAHVPYPAAGSDCQSENAVPSLSVQAANQPCVGTGDFSSAVPPSSRTFAIEASMSSVA